MKKEHKIKTFPNDQKLREFVANKSKLHEVTEEFIQVKCKLLQIITSIHVKKAKNISKANYVIIKYVIHTYFTSFLPFLDFEKHQ